MLVIGAPTHIFTHKILSVPTIGVNIKIMFKKYITVFVFNYQLFLLVTSEQCSFRITVNIIRNINNIVFMHV